MSGLGPVVLSYAPPRPAVDEPRTVVAVLVYADGTSEWRLADGSFRWWVWLPSDGET